MPTKVARNETRGVLGRLISDQSGNVIAMMAAAMIPLIGVVGGAVDISRGYMTKARLQAACDAGTLAGRKAMTDLTFPTTAVGPSGSTPGNAKWRAEKLFNFNFKPAEFSTTSANTTFTTSGNAQGVVSGVATTTIPTVLIKIVGKPTLTLTVNCNADFQVPNIDTVLVLDVTGSMADCPDDTNCNSNSSSKIAGLKTAVKSFYTTLQSAAAANPLTQIRYGIVPYSQTTNGKNMFVASPASYQLPLTQLTDNWTYQSRVAQFDVPTYGSAVQSSAPIVYNNVNFRRPGNSTDTPTSNVDCTDYSNNNDISLDGGPDQGYYTPQDYTPSPSGYPLYRINSSSALTSTAPTNTASFEKIEYSRVTANFTSDGVTPSTFKVCTRQEKITTFVRPVKYGFTKWIYKPVSLDVSQYKNGSTINYISAINESNALVDTSGTYDLVALSKLPDQSKFSQENTTWDGCIEERDTVAVKTFTPIPDEAKDLDYLNLGTNNSTKWRPIIDGYWDSGNNEHGLTYLRDSSAEQEQLKGASSVPTGTRVRIPVCPSAPMQNLLTMSSAQMDTVTASLVAGGNTYHDIGMVWALRMISPYGMFKSRNGVASNGGQISRNIIFMTDGTLAPNENAYSSYGMERVEKRVSGATGLGIDELHKRRFQALCDAARSQGISVWTIAFGTSNPSNLIACADTGHAYTATNTADLTKRFQDIAKSIADLRLTK